MNTKKNLVIVESKEKASTINRFLGKNYIVIPSYGHIIDLPKSRLAVDIDGDFEPDYITVRGKGKILEQIKKLSSNANEVLLATDADREGEAISWHLKNVIDKKTPGLHIRRIVFKEITKRAILESIKDPLDIDIQKVKAQKARRVLDRIVGYFISPFLWQKVKKGLSAGRVQSVALKIICDREIEIEKFVPQEYWTIGGIFKKGKHTLQTALIKYENKKPVISSETESNAVIKELKKEKGLVKDIQNKEVKKNPVSAYITSKLQQDASNHFGFPSSKTMQIAQELYEGIDLGKERTGLITYMRTDSQRISDDAIQAVRKFIVENYGEENLPEKPNEYKNKRRSQDAHECIRPVDIFITPLSIKQFLSNDQFKLYQLIWQKFVSCQMKPAVYDRTQVDIQTGKGIFRVTSSKLVFEGFRKVFMLEEVDDEDSVKVKLPPLKLGEELQVDSIEGKQHFTEAPPKYTEASLLKKLEEEEIGRPSTYATIITTLLKRYYVQKKQKQLSPTKLGMLTNQLVSDNFPNIVDIRFTANMERLLDTVEEENIDWVHVVRDFYSDFNKSVQEATVKVEKMGNMLNEETDYVCELCGSPMLKKLGKNGFFLACSAFPNCRNAKPLPLGACPKDDCSGHIIQIKMRRRSAFYGCSRYPECDFITWDKPSEQNCPHCGKILFEKFSKEKGYFNYCQNKSCTSKEKVN